MSTTPERAQLGAEPTLAELEAYYGITFSDLERKWLTTSKQLLSPIGKQLKYLLERALAPLECPACNAVTCVRATYQADDFAEALRGPMDDDNYAHSCGARLTWHLEITGRTWFTLQPGQVITVGDGGGQTQLTGEQLDLLRTYAQGPHTWDAADLAVTVSELHQMGLIEDAPVAGDGEPASRGSCQLTDKGRAVLTLAVPHS